MNKKIIFIFFIFITLFAGCGTSNKLLTDEGVDRYELAFLHNKERMIKNLTQFTMMNYKKKLKNGLSIWQRQIN